MDSDHYAILGLPSGEEGAKLSDKEIAKAYRVKALELHPDKRPNDPNANIFFQKLKASYEILRDRKARREYDDVLRARRDRTAKRSCMNDGKQFRAKHKRKQEEELASMNAKRRAAAATPPPMPPPGWKEENEDGPWKSLERFQAYEDLVLGNMRRAAERQKMAQRVMNMRRFAAESVANLEDVVDVPRHDPLALAVPRHHSRQVIDPGTTMQSWNQILGRWHQSKSFQRNSLLVQFPIAHIQVDPCMAPHGYGSFPMQCCPKVIKAFIRREGARMDEDQEMERFGMENDFDDGEFYYRNRKEKRVRTKDDVLYGIFASGDSSDSDYEGRGKKRKKESEAGSFEKHTKGIGMKLLEKMGYKGGGLGKNEQGITAHIEAKLRPKNMGMGFNDYKEIKVPVLQESEAKSALLSPTHKREKPWLKQASKKKVYITVEELLARKQEEQGQQVVQKLFDMRGPQVRVLTNLKNLNAEEKERENDILMPEFHHNVVLMVDLAELDFQKIDGHLRNERETVAALQKEKEKLQAEAVYQKKQFENMEYIMNELDRIDKESKEGTLTLDSLVNSFLDLQQRYADDYKLFNLSSIACSHALPLFIRVFQGWDPLQNPEHGLEIISSWKNLLQDNSSLYSQLFMEVVFPAIRISGTNTWQARDPEPMLGFLDSWEKLLPTGALYTILDNIVLPKLVAAVDSWDPRRETIPIHSWTIFTPSSWGELMGRFIVPKLLAVMNEFQVNPANQSLDQFYWVRTWATVIPIHQMLPLMDIFFNKWQEVLYHWLCSNPDFEQVTKWFLGWKELLPPQLFTNNHIRYRLIVCQDMMNQAAESREVVHPSLRDNMSYLRAVENMQFETEKNVAAQQGDDIDSGSELSLKAIIEAHAQQNGLLFKPKPGRIHDGYQIYGFGSLSIIMDSLNEKVFAQIEDKWSPMCLELLLELQNRRQ
nr:septin and tuftelin-interacting protein 1 homolog 1-like [Ipomoea batatas]